MKKSCDDRSRGGFVLGRALFAAAGSAVLVFLAAPVAAEPGIARTEVVANSEAAKSEAAKPGQATSESVKSGKPKRVKTARQERRPRSERRRKARSRVGGGCSGCGVNDGDLSPGVSIGVGAGGPVGGW